MSYELLQKQFTKASLFHGVVITFLSLLCITLIAESINMYVPISELLDLQLILGNLIPSNESTTLSNLLL